MVVRQKPELRNIFVTGAVPTQQDFTDFIDSYIASINGNMPTADGNVLVPVNFNVMTEILPSKLPHEFDEGRTVAIHNYVKGGNDPWETILPPEVESGEIFISTTRFDEQDVTFQEIDTNRDGVFFSNVSRVASGNVWGTPNFHPFIRSINGVMTPFDGNVVVPTAPTITNYRFHQRILNNTFPVSFNVPGIKENNYTYSAQFSDDGIYTDDGSRVVFTVDEDAETFTVNTSALYNAPVVIHLFISVFS